jgi:hypothetical protein
MNGCFFSIVERISSLNEKKLRKILATLRVGVDICSVSAIEIND